MFVVESVHEDSLRSLMRRVLDVLAEDDQVDGDLRFYILRLVQSIELTLDDKTIGRGFDIAEATRQLWVALRAAEGAGTKRSHIWRETWLQMTAGTLAGAAVEIGKVSVAAVTDTA